MKSYDLVAVVPALPWRAVVGASGPMTPRGGRMQQAVVESEGAGLVVPFPLVPVGVIVPLPPPPGALAHKLLLLLVVVIIGGL